MSTVATYFDKHYLYQNLLFCKFMEWERNNLTLKQHSAVFEEIYVMNNENFTLSLEIWDLCLKMCWFWPRSNGKFKQSLQCSINAIHFYNIFPESQGAYLWSFNMSSVLDLNNSLCAERKNGCCLSLLDNRLCFKGKLCNRYLSDSNLKFNLGVK